MSVQITKARAALIMTQPFFGSLALRLKVVEAPAVKTMAVDGTHLFFNPAFVEELTFDELTGVVAHEVMHLACGHHARRQGRNLKTWNVACDYAINGILKQSGFVLPKGVKHDPCFDNMSAEQIYDLLNRDDDGGGDNKSGGGAGAGDGADAQPPNASDAPDPGGCGAVIDAPAPDGGAASPCELETAKKDWEVAALQAAQFAKAAGKTPAGLDRILDEIRRPRIDWRAVLRRFVDVAARNDYQWTPPNRRYVASGLYLPSLSSQQMGRIVIAVDTSRSIDDDLLTQFASEMTAIAEDCRPEQIDVVYCDANVARVEHFRPEDLPLRLEPKGRGGTSFCPPFEWVEKEGFTPACFVYLTDMYGRFPDTPPPYPVLWAATSDVVAPFGETLRLDSH